MRQLDEWGQCDSCGDWFKYRPPNGTRVFDEIADSLIPEAEDPEDCRQRWNAVDKSAVHVCHSWVTSGKCLDCFAEAYGIYSPSTRCPLKFCSMTTGPFSGDEWGSLQAIKYVEDHDGRRQS